MKKKVISMLLCMVMTYLAPLGIKCQKLEFTFRYIQKHGEYGSYNILDNPDEFILEIDGQGIND